MFNVFRRHAKLPLRSLTRPSLCHSTRLYATTQTFVPPTSLDDVETTLVNGPPKPQSPNFYSGRAPYLDQMNVLEDAVMHTRKALTKLHLLPLPQFAQDALPPLRPVWKNKLAMSKTVGMKLKTSRYRKLTKTLNQLELYKTVASTAGYGEFASRIEGVLQVFERENKAAVLARGKRKPVQFDSYGRSYTVGRRKTSTARVWMIAVKEPPQPQKSKVPSKQDELRELAKSNPDLAANLPTSVSDPTSSTHVPTTNILVNGVALSQYFPRLADRERIVRPFKIAGLLGAYNVFSLARGGGITGQSGAVALGVAKGLAAHVPDIEQILRKAKLLRRDPRMVERKKTGLLKARKARTWVKR